MTRVKRGGRELIVDDAVVAEYLGNGYSVIDDRGNEITRGKALDYATAMRELAEVKAHDAALAIALDEANAKIKALTAENKKLRSAAKSEKNNE